MPTNFHVSSQPALRWVPGESYRLTAADHPAGFFTRRRLTERLVIQSGAQQAINLAAGEWVGSCAQLELATGFRQKISHA